MKLRGYLDCVEDEKVWAILREFYAGLESTTGRQLSYSLGLNHKTVTRYLERLCGFCVLEKEVVGRAYVYRLKHNYLTAQVLKPLIESESKFFDKLTAQIVRVYKPYCHSVVVAGDYARDKETFESSLDLHVLYVKPNEKLTVLTDKLIKRYDELYDLSLSVNLLMMSERASLKSLKTLTKSGEWIFGDKQQVVDFYKRHCN